ncbi:MAG TPA: DUF4258 domain-containing protein [Pyrinomonadaceae bacterium]|nr:DUF4258 domain-containing protein [Pyrinomonadaceae bacterium]
MKHYYENVPELGNVAVSRHAQDRIREDGITDKEFEDALFKGELIPDTHEASFRDLNRIRLVIIHRPEPFKGAKLIKTAFRIQAQKRAY